MRYKVLVNVTKYKYFLTTQPCSQNTPDDSPSICSFNNCSLSIVNSLCWYVLKFSLKFRKRLGTNVIGVTTLILSKKQLLDVVTSVPSWHGILVSGVTVISAN